MVRAAKLAETRRPVIPRGGPTHHSLGGKGMKNGKKEVERRTAAALTAIRQAMDGGDSESSVPLFVSHHIEELDAAYWKKHAGAVRPSPEKVLDLLQLREHWGDEDEDGLDVFDFTLPDDVTDYVLSVRFDDEGKVEDISMES